MSYGKIEYYQEGNPKCEICGLFFTRVLPHVWQNHEMNERYYKMMYGFDLIKGICSEKSSAKTRKKTLKNYEKCIRKNLNIRGKRTKIGVGDRKVERFNEDENGNIIITENIKHQRP